MEKKGINIYDAMRPTTRINVQLERNRKQSTQFRKGENRTKKKGKGMKKRSTRALATGGKGHKYVDINARKFFVGVVFSYSACSMTSIEYRNTGY